MKRILVALPEWVWKIISRKINGENGLSYDVFSAIESPKRKKFRSTKNGGKKISV